MLNTVLGKSIRVCKIAAVGAVLVGLSQGSKDLHAQSPASLQIRSEALSVTLDPKFPRSLNMRRRMERAFRGIWSLFARRSS